MPFNAENHSPLKPVFFMILLVLLDGDRHGYGIVKDIEDRTDGSMRLEPGNLYRYIKKLMELEYVTETDDRHAPDAEDERRRYYAITALGREVMAREAARMKALAAAAQSKLRRRGSRA
jgi:DNA-binding PadR family transcriptional regulator